MSGTILRPVHASREPHTSNNQHQNHQNQKTSKSQNLKAATSLNLGYTLHSFLSAAKKGETVVAIGRAVKVTDVQAETPGIKARMHASFLQRRKSSLT